VATAPHPTVGLVDGRYRLGPVLGSGGMATVHRAWDTRLERAVAVKLYRSTADRGAHRRFHEEARTLAGLSHPGLVTVHDFGTADDGPYLVLQLVDGGTLRRRLEDGPVPADEVRPLGARVAAALAHVHAAGIIHRDIKPSNILLDNDGTPYLADFGVSLLVDSDRLTATGQLLGTAAYLAPEQVLGRRLDPPVDVYGLGLVLLECLTGRTEYDGNDVETAVARLYREPRITGAVPADLAVLLGAMTHLDPAHRPTAAECATRLARPAPAAPPRPTEVQPPWVTAPPWAVTPVTPAAAAPSTATWSTVGPAMAVRSAGASAPVVSAPAKPATVSAPALAALHRVMPVHRLPAVAAGLVLVAVAMTVALLASGTPSGATPDAIVPAGPSEVGVVAPAGLVAPTTAVAPQPQQVITEVVTVVVPPPAAGHPAQHPAPAPPKGKGKKPKGDDD